MAIFRSTKQRLQFDCKIAGVFLILVFVLGFFVLSAAVHPAFGVNESNSQTAISQPESNTPTTPQGKSDQEAAGDKAKLDQKAAKPNTDYSWQSVALVILSLSLLAFLFWFLFKYSQKLEKASYLGDLYKDSMEEIEYQRLAYIPQQKLELGDYRREIQRDLSWLNEHQFPLMPDALRGIVPERHPWSYGSLKPGGSGIGGLGSSKESVCWEPKHEQTSKIIDELSAKYRGDIEKWQDAVDNEAYLRYKGDLKLQRDKARQKAEKAIDIDLTVLRGRTPAFILEFTAVVIIIFAAVILGILDILKNEQIGTLLAAIAGYVLGRSASRVASDGSQPQKPTAGTSTGSVGDTGAGAGTGAGASDGAQVTGK